MRLGGFVDGDGVVGPSERVGGLSEDNRVGWDGELLEEEVVSAIARRFLAYRERRAAWRHDVRY